MVLAVQRYLLTLYLIRAYFEGKSQASFGTNVRSTTSSLSRHELNPGVRSMGKTLHVSFSFQFYYAPPQHIHSISADNEGDHNVTSGILLANYMKNAQGWWCLSPISFAVHLCSIVTVPISSSGRQAIRSIFCVAHTIWTDFVLNASPAIVFSVFFLSTPPEKWTTVDDSVDRRT